MSEERAGVRQILKPLLNLGSIFGLGCCRKPSSIKIFYIFIIASFHVLSLIHGLKEPEKYQDIVSKFKVIFMRVLVSVACITMMISTNFTGSTRFLRGLEHFDNSIGVRVPRRKFLLWFTMVFHRVEMSSFILCGIYQIITLKPFPIEHMVGLLFGQYQIDVGRFFVYWLSTEFCLRFKMLQLRLVDSFNAIQELSSSENDIIFIHQKRFLKTIKKVSKLYNSLCDELNVMNHKYGLTLLFDVLVCMSLIIDIFTVTIRLLLISKLEQHMWFYAMWCLNYSVSVCN